MNTTTKETHSYTLIEKASQELNLTIDYVKVCGIEILHIINCITVQANGFVSMIAVRCGFTVSPVTTDKLF